MIRRLFTTAVFRGGRTPLAEELVEPVVLKAGSLNAELLNTVKDYVPPMLSAHLESSLSDEFGRRIVRTDWSHFQDPLIEAQKEQAARLLEMTLSSLQLALKTIPSKDLSKLRSEWVERECQRLWNEIQTGETARWEDPALLIRGWDKLSDACKNHVLPAISILAKNPNLHPRAKRLVLREIVTVINATI